MPQNPPKNLWELERILGYLGTSSRVDSEESRVGETMVSFVSYKKKCHIGNARRNPHTLNHNPMVSIHVDHDITTCTESPIETNASLYKGSP
jgi:hypothetical protein